MIKAKIGVPVGEPLILYKKEIINRRFDSKELKEFVEKTRDNLEDICGKIDEKISMASFYLTLKEPGADKYLEIMSHTTDLTAFDSMKKGTSWIKNIIKSDFRYFLNKIEDRIYCLDINIDFVGFRDKITEIVDAFEPPKT